MKKLLSLLISLSSLIVYGQTSEEFVEVIVTDTITTDAEEIVYTLFCYTEPSITEITEAPFKAGMKPSVKKDIPVKKGEETTEEKVRSVIKKMSIDTLTATLYTFENEMFSGTYKNTFNLIFKSNEKLRSFLSEIHGINGITGFISQKKSSQENLLNQTLMKRLIEKAASEATMIASQCKKTLIKLIQLKEEIIENAPGGWTIYPPLSALAQAEYSNTSAKIIIAKKLIVRYSWN